MPLGVSEHHVRHQNRVTESHWKGQSTSVLQYPPKAFRSVLIPDCTDYGRGNRRMGACSAPRRGEAALVSTGLGQGYSDRR